MWLDSPFDLCIAETVSLLGRRDGRVGRRHSLAKGAYVLKTYQEFESLSLRHFLLVHSPYPYRLPFPALID